MKDGRTKWFTVSVEAGFGWPIERVELTYEGHLITQTHQCSRNRAKEGSLSVIFRGCRARCKDHRCLSGMGSGFSPDSFLRGRTRARNKYLHVQEVAAKRSYLARDQLIIFSTRACRFSLPTRLASPSPFSTDSSSVTASVRSSLMMT